MPYEMFFQTGKGDHKFNIGDIKTLTGLESCPQYNGTQVEIIGYRRDEAFGVTYYVSGEINNVFDWVYEYRMI